MTYDVLTVLMCIPSQLGILVLKGFPLLQRCGTVTIFYGSGSGSDFRKVTVLVLVPIFDTLRFRIRIRI
jgi:hypothetical protein